MKTHTGLLKIGDDVTILDDGRGFINYWQDNLPIFRLFVSIEKFSGRCCNGLSAIMRVGIAVTELF